MREQTANSSVTIKGDHGFDNNVKNMWPFFVARGPAFKKNHQHAGGVEQVDIYPLMCELLQNRCEPHDGDLRRVQDLLVPEPNGATTPAASAFALVALAAVRLFQFC